MYCSICKIQMCLIALNLLYRIYLRSKSNNFASCFRFYADKSSNCIRNTENIPSLMLIDCICSDFVQYWKCEVFPEKNCNFHCYLIHLQCICIYHTQCIRRKFLQCSTLNVFRRKLFGYPVDMHSVDTWTIDCNNDSNDVSPF